MDWLVTGFGALRRLKKKTAEAITPRRLSVDC